MLPTTIRSPPSVADYIPLAEYESQTPASFLQGKPVLHYHLPGAAASVPKSQKNQLAIFTSVSATTETNGPGNGEAAEETVEQSVELFVNSETFTVWNSRAEVGVSIPYIAISIHAVKRVTPPGSSSSRPAVWMQLELSSGGASDEEFDLVELTVVPPSQPETDPEQESRSSPAYRLYEAMAACSNLHVDSRNEEEDDEGEDGNYNRIIWDRNTEHEPIEGFAGVMHGATDGGLPPPMPGSGGWITAENVHEYFDEDGNWIGQGAEGEEDGVESLGEGAGRTRGRDEVEADGMNGHNEDEDAEAKRVRTG